MCNELRCFLKNFDKIIEITHTQKLFINAYWYSLQTVVY